MVFFQGTEEKKSIFVGYYILMLDKNDQNNNLGLGLLFIFQIGIVYKYYFPKT